MRKTVVAPWTEHWLERYREEEALLKAVFPKEERVDIHHIGSTSVSHIGYAKPIIDMLVVVKSIAKVDEYNEAMMRLGYEPRGEQGIAGRRYFAKGGDQRTHHVHIYDPEEAKAYGELKLRLAKQFPDQVHEYQEGKASFCREILRKAMSWASGNADASHR
ncbi:GrpB family protein [Paenibacillus ginsengihumi]|uniref:GrpB family protein n=1 Tax=Paenibacillus ginsengihumi TaxID=431596 RepID=UPI00037F2CE4|nr:GrpB family protein [Paenibacillus ginsengihumi]